MENKEIDYNQEPVTYCPHCLSLKIKVDEELNVDAYCDECGSTDVETTDIYTWEKMYEERYNKNFLTDKSIDIWKELRKKK